MFNVNVFKDEREWLAEVNDLDQGVIACQVGTVGCRKEAADSSRALREVDEAHGVLIDLALLIQGIKANSRLRRSLLMAQDGGSGIDRGLRPDNRGPGDLDAGQGRASTLVDRLRQRLQHSVDVGRRIEVGNSADLRVQELGPIHSAEVVAFVQTCDHIVY